MDIQDRVERENPTGTFFTTEVTYREEILDQKNEIDFASNPSTTITFNIDCNTNIFSSSLASDQLFSPTSPAEITSLIGNDITTMNVSQPVDNNYSNGDASAFDLQSKSFPESPLHEIKVDLNQLSPSLAIVTTSSPNSAQVSVPCNSIVTDPNVFVSEQPGEDDPNWDQRETVKALLKEKGITKDILMRILDENDNQEQEIISSSGQCQLECEDNVNGGNDSQLQKEDDELPGDLANELLKQEPLTVAKIIKSYMTQNNVLQRELVEATNLNQSHLSQHFNRGTPMKTSKRVKLYNWFERHQIRNRQEPSAPSTSQSAKRRRPRWKWSNIAIQILTEAYKKNRFPTREQRLELARICNEAEQAIAEDRPWNIPDGEWERINETRIYTWFTNKRKLESRQDPSEIQMISPTTGTLGQIGQDAFKIKRELIESENSNFGLNEFGKRALIPKSETSPMLINKVFHYNCGNLRHL
ncbi:hepatic nuclear factor 1 (Hnf-1) transcription factor [Oopsacas minuta]|uniref:Hepatic nuclear factor 1 (Hnf-1) transcription factor n=1 Tax=Oopsacas minuta TaxID=111878 RepID=A0AAV7KHQ9_9METZ|nr:hepatic nuclear factor 1 (Hnf-1) transcription factor [Oopsacas minuta]